eukprot:9248326-Alexandrium_andersonii.AAC.1
MKTAILPLAPRLARSYSAPPHPQTPSAAPPAQAMRNPHWIATHVRIAKCQGDEARTCLLYTSDAADDM